MKRKSRRMAALVLFAVVVTAVAIAGAAAFISVGGKLARDMEGRLSDLLDMDVSVGGTRRLSPTALVLRNVSVSALGEEEKIAFFREMSVQFEGEEGGEATVEITGGSLSLGDEASRQQAAIAIGRLMRKSGVSRAQCSVSDMLVTGPGLVVEGLEQCAVTGLALSAQESGALDIELGTVEGYLADNKVFLEGSAGLSPRGALAFSLKARQDAEGAFRAMIADTLGAKRARCVLDFTGMEELEISNTSVKRTVRKPDELKLTLLPLYDELGLEDRYNAIRTLPEEFELVLTDGVLEGLTFVVSHDKQQFGESSTSYVSSRFLRTMVYLARGESIKLPLGKDTFSFNDLEFSVTLSGDTVTIAGRMSRQGQWIEVTDEEARDASVVRLSEAAVDRAELAKRWGEVQKWNADGWEEEKPVVPLIKIPTGWDLLHDLLGGEAAGE